MVENRESSHDEKVERIATISVTADEYQKLKALEGVWVGLDGRLVAIWFNGAKTKGDNSYP